MKTLFNVLSYIVKAIAAVVFVSGIVLAVLGGYHFVEGFFFLRAQPVMPGLIGTALLTSIVYFLVAIVFFVFALGVLALFTNKPERDFPINFPQWLRIKSFMQLKVILWEAILTTLVIMYLTGLVEKQLKAEKLLTADLFIPGAIFLMAISLFLIKRGEH